MVSVMGLIACRAKMLLEARKNGVDFSSTLTLGRQSCNMTDAELSQLRKKYGICEIANAERLLKYRAYADQFFYHYLGVKELYVLDNSDYQGANTIHDLNCPIPSGLMESFDVVIDGGTLEHIFNFPQAITNCMKMVKMGGNLFIFSMANNHCGHGFYQFSPELFFRIFSNIYGFETRAVILVRHPFPGAELSRKQECFLVKDPATVGRRSVIVTKSPLGIMVHAEKIAHKTLFDEWPQQSDYVRIQGENEMEKRRQLSGNTWRSLSKDRLKLLLTEVWNRLPFGLRMHIAGFHQLWSCSVKHDKDFYSRWP